MKKKLCIFLMLAGLAAIAGTILLGGYPDSSTAWMLIFLSLVTIAAAAFHINEPDEVSGGKKAFLGVTFIVSVAAAILVGLIFISFSPSIIYTLIFVIIVAITVAAWFRHIKDENEPKVTRRGMVFLSAFRTISILAILVCLAFIVIMFFLMRDLVFSSHINDFPLIELSLAGITAAAMSLKLRAPVSGRGIARAVRCVPIAIALVIAASLCFIYLNYMPKYSEEDGMNMLRSNEEFAQKDVYSNIGFTVIGKNEITKRETAIPYYMELFGDNPFYTDIFEYGCDSYSYDANGLHLVKGYIYFDPATGAYQYKHAQDQDKSYRPGELPWLDYNYMYDRDGQHDAVLNLFFRGWLSSFDTNDTYFGVFGTYKEFIVHSGEWDAKMKDVMYPHNFPEDEALAFLKSMGEATLRAELLEQTNRLSQNHEDNTIEVFFFGIDIATYQNGEIVLKI